MNFESLKSSVQDLSEKYDKEGASEDIIQVAERLQIHVIDFFKNTDKSCCSASYFEPLLRILRNEVKLLEKTFPDVSRKNLSLIDFVLVCLRSSFFKQSSNQQMIVEKEEFLSPLLDLLSALTQRFLKNKTSLQQPKQELPVTVSRQVENSLTSPTLLCITCFVNMMAGNPPIRSALWPSLKPLLLNAVSYPVPKVGHAGAALLHQFLLDAEYRKHITREDGSRFIPPLLGSYQVEGPHSCFSLFCLEFLLETADPLSSCWDALSPQDSLLSLDILTTLLQKNAERVPLATVQFLQKAFQKDADTIFQLHKNTRTSLQPSVVARMTNFLSCAASSDRFRPELQKEKSLLISSVYLLRGITTAGNESENEFSRLGDKRATDAGELEVQSPLFGFKTDLTRLIAALVYRNNANQDTVRECDGVLLILENSQFDSRNPLIREASILALRNLLEGNRENQRVIAELEIRGVAQNDTLSELGLEAQLVNGKISLQQT